MRITVTVFKDGLAKEAELSRITRRIQRKERLGYKIAIIEAEKRFNPVEYTQVIHSESEEIDFQTLGEHIAKGKPFHITKE